MRFKLALCFAVAFGFAVGCGGPQENAIVVENLPGPAELLKKGLEEAASTGNPIGSGGFAMEGYAEQLAKDDPAKSQALLAGIKELSQISEPAKVKSKAKELLSKL